MVSAQCGCSFRLRWGMCGRYKLEKLLAQWRKQVGWRQMDTGFVLEGGNKAELDNVCLVSVQNSRTQLQDWYSQTNLYRCKWESRGWVNEYVCTHTYCSGTRHAVSSSTAWIWFGQSLRQTEQPVNRHKVINLSSLPLLDYSEGASSSWQVIYVCSSSVTFISISSSITSSTPRSEPFKTRDTDRSETNLLSHPVLVSKFNNSPQRWKESQSEWAGTKVISCLYDVSTCNFV